MTRQTPGPLESSNGPTHTQDQPGKRRAEDSLSCSSPKRRRVSEISSVPLWCQSPHPLSVNGLMRKHCKNRLYVRPLQWTAQHLELLGYRFVRKGNQKFRGHSKQNSLQLPSKARILEAIEDILIHREPVPEFAALISNAFITAFLKDCHLIQLRYRLAFRFKRQFVATARQNGLFSHPDRSSRATLAFLDLEDVSQRRNRIIGLSRPKRAFDDPVRRIKLTQRRRIEPLCEAEDPYIVSVLIALAQGLQRQRPPQKESANGHDERLEEPVAATKPDPDNTVLPPQILTDTNFEVRLIALSKDSRILYFYKASIPSVSLDALNEPSHYHENTNGVQISYHAVRLKACKESVQSIQDIISRGYLGV
jgi:hypothetical protein